MKNKTGLIIFFLVATTSIFFGSPVISKTNNYELSNLNIKEQSLIETALNDDKEINKLGVYRSDEALKLIDKQPDIDNEDLKKALFYAASGADLNPDSVKSWVVLGLVWMAQKNNRLAYEEAQKSFETALLLKPQDDLVSFLLGQALFFQGKYFAARQTWMPVILHQGNNKMSIDLSVLIAQTYILSKNVKSGLIQVHEIYPDHPNNMSLLCLLSLLELAQYHQAQYEYDNVSLPKAQRIAFLKNSSLSLQTILSLWKKMPEHKKNNTRAYYIDLLESQINANNNQKKVE